MPDNNPKHLAERTRRAKKDLAIARLGYWELFKMRLRRVKRAPSTKGLEHRSVAIQHRTDGVSNYQARKIRNKAIDVLLLSLCFFTIFLLMMYVIFKG